MTENQIKKLVELAELAHGFDISLDKMKKPLIQYKNSTQYLEDIDKWEHYPLLLYRLAAGFNLINTEDDYKYINIDADIIDYSNGVNTTWQSGLRGSQRLWYKNYTPNIYLTAQEQALEAALEEVLCK